MLVSPTSSTILIYIFKINNLINITNFENAISDVLFMYSRLYIKYLLVFSNNNESEIYRKNRQKN